MYLGLHSALYIIIAYSMTWVIDFAYLLLVIIKNSGSPTYYWIPYLLSTCFCRKSNLKLMQLKASVRHTQNGHRFPLLGIGCFQRLGNILYLACWSLSHCHKFEKTWHLFDWLFFSRLYSWKMFRMSWLKN